MLALDVKMRSASCMITMLLRWVDVLNCYFELRYIFILRESWSIKSCSLVLFSKSFYFAFFLSNKQVLRNPGAMNVTICSFAVLLVGH